MSRPTLNQALNRLRKQPKCHELVRRLYEELDYLEGLIADLQAKKAAAEKVLSHYVKL